MMMEKMLLYIIKYDNVELTLIYQCLLLLKGCLS